MQKSWVFQLAQQLFLYLYKLAEVKKKLGMETEHYSITQNTKCKIPIMHRHRRGVSGSAIDN